MAFKDMLGSIGKKKRAKEAQNRAKNMAIGVATGVAAAMLLVSKTGKEVRTGLKKGAVKTGRAIKGTFSKKTAEVKEKVKEAKE